ncbi:hypothetical protein V8F06_014115 [Rhypophila decipiens]
MNTTTSVFIPFIPVTSSSCEYTISQDTGTGDTARVEAGYSLLAARDDLELANQPTASRNPNQSLQDYQMQLMLLEQQNKKRLMMSRQELDEPKDDLVRAFKDFSSGAATDGLNGDDQEDHDSSMEELESEGSESDQEDHNSPTEEQDSEDSENDQSELQDKSDHLFARKRSENSDQSSNTRGLGSPRVKRLKKSDDFMVGIPGGTISEDSQSFSSQGMNREEDETEGPEGYRVLYRVACSDKQVRCHRRIYQDEPRRVVIKGEYHLCGAELIPDLDDFLVRSPATAFIVYRDFFCEKGSRSTFLGANSTKPASKSFREIISVVSEELHETLQRNSLFAPDHAAYKGSAKEGDAFNSTALSTSPSEYSHQFLYHHREILSAANERHPQDGPVMALLSYLRSCPDPMYAKCDALFSRGAVTKDSLPWLFRPNEVVVSNEGPLQMAHVLKHFPIVDSTLRLSCWNWGYDGHWLQRKPAPLLVEIPSFGEKSITALAAYPLRFAQQEVRERILTNGKRFWDLRRPVLIAYEGPDYRGERDYPSDSRFMIDYQVYRKFHEHAEAFRFSFAGRATFDSWPEKLPGNLTPSNLQLMLLPAGIYGFYFKEKKWIRLLVDHTRPVNWNKKAFEQLVLPKRTKSLVKGLVMVRKQTLGQSDLKIGLKGKSNDIIAGKGSGLIMLLHGGPGTGKTLTAALACFVPNHILLNHADRLVESVAELAEMPLYSVTCGDIGTSPEAVEKYLNAVLLLGKKWNCVLLLDEADVFLEERSLSDLERNSLVSVFLRTLEYYDGVLILTSNRVGTFDEAFKSRIQLALHYPPLDAPGRRKIWHNFLNMLADNQEDVDLDDIKAHMDQLAGYNLNGRQIRNALTTARQLSLFESETLDWDRLKDSIEVAGDFNKYLEGLHGHTEEQWTRENNLR